MVPAATDHPVSELGAQRHTVSARGIDQIYQIDVLPVVSPLRPPAPGDKLPVVFVLDRNLHFRWLPRPRRCSRSIRSR